MGHQEAALAARLDAATAELRQAEAKLAEIDRHARSTNSRDGGLVIAASHDLRQPLHVLSMYLGVLEARLRSEQDRRLLGKMGRAVAGLGAQLDVLTDVSQLEAGDLTPRPERVPLEQLLKPLLQAEDRQITLDSDPAGLAVKVDARLVQRLLAQIARALPDPALQIGFETAEGSLRLILRAATQGRPSGLALARRLAGNLALDLEARGDSTLVLTLPLAAGALSIVSTEALGNGDQPLVLVIEDEIESRQAMTGLIESWGYRVQAFATGSEVLGLERGQLAKPAAILADQRLPGAVTGHQTIEVLRRRFGPVPAILVSADVHGDGLHFLHDVVFMRKPVNPDALRSALEIFTGGEAGPQRDRPAAAAG